MNPTQSDVNVNAPLSNFTALSIQDQDTFVADKVFTEIPVEHQSGTYFEYSRADFNRDEMAKLAPGTESKGSGYGLTATATYSADVWSLHKDIPDQVRANAMGMINVDLDATKFLVNKYLISRERQFASTFFASSVWTTDYTGVASGPSTNQVLQWSDSASTPIEDIRKLKAAVQLASGQRPNKLTVSRQVFDTLLDHPDLVDRIKYSSSPSAPALTNRQTLAQIFELDEVLVMDAIYNSAAEGSETNAFIGSKGALLTYSPASPSLLSISAGFTFNWTSMFGSTLNGTRILTYNMPWIKSTRVEIEAAYALKKVSADCGAFVASVIA